LHVLNLTPCCCDCLQATLVVLHLQDCAGVALQEHRVLGLVRRQEAQVLLCLAVLR
jgi:hypothetical protein